MEESEIDLFLFLAVPMRRVPAELRMKEMSQCWEIHCNLYQSTCRSVSMATGASDQQRTDQKGDKSLHKNSCKKCLHTFGYFFFSFFFLEKKKKKKKEKSLNLEFFESCLL